MPNPIRALYILTQQKLVSCWGYFATKFWLKCLPCMAFSLIGRRHSKFMFLIKITPMLTGLLCDSPL